MENYCIRKGKTTFEPSQYQKDILHFCHTGIGNGFINACAGASKTTILENIIYHVPQEKKKLFIAFNKSIVEEMNSRIDSNEVLNLNITTHHSLGFNILMENYPNIKFEIDENKYSNFLRNNIVQLSNYENLIFKNNEYNTYIRNIIHLIDYARYYHVSSIRQIRNIAEKYGLNILRNECIVCKNILAWGRENIETIDFTDMVWLVNELNLNTKRHLYDIILIDEAQDTSIMQQELIERCKKRGCRLFAVGDRHQAINVWCGADSDAVQKFKGENVTEFELPITYRCPKKIVELAKQYSPNIKAADNAEDGVIRYNVPKHMPLSNDMVLCRNTSPIIEYFLFLLRANKKAYIKGSEGIYDTLSNIIVNSNANIIDINCETHDGLMPKLYQSLICSVDNLIKQGYTDDEAYRHPSILDMYDNILSIKYLSDNLTTTNELLSKIKVVFSDRNNEGIILSTIHKAKGLEADNVFILCPSLLPNPYVKKEWEIISEEHLVYVAYTRAKKSLNFIEEPNITDPYKSKSIFNMKNIIKDIREMRKKISLNIENNITEKDLLEKKNNEENILGSKKQTSLNKKKTKVSNNMFS